MTTLTKTKGTGWFSRSTSRFTMAFKQKLFADMKELLHKFHTLTPAQNMEDVRLLFSDFAGKELPVRVLVDLMGMGHEMGVPSQQDGHAVTFAQLSNLFCAGVQVRTAHISFESGRSRRRGVCIESCVLSFSTHSLFCTGIGHRGEVDTNGTKTH